MYRAYPIFPHLPRETTHLRTGRGVTRSRVANAIDRLTEHLALEADLGVSKADVAEI